MKPTAAPPWFPYNHRTMEAVMKEEDTKRAKWRHRYNDNFKSLRK